MSRCGQKICVNRLQDVQDLIDDREVRESDILEFKTAPDQMQPADKNAAAKALSAFANSAENELFSRRNALLLPTGTDPSGTHVHNVTRRSSCAFTATTTVLKDMRIAPTAGFSTIPHGASTPAASGIAAML